LIELSLPTIRDLSESVQITISNKYKPHSATPPPFQILFVAYHAGRGVLGDSDIIAERWGLDYTHASEMRFHHDHLN
jgi:hypothetical protein